VLTISLSLAAVSCGEFGGRPKAKVTARVVDDAGQPVSGANVVVLGSYAHLEAPWREGVSDEDGLFTAELASDSTLSFKAEANGFHRVSRMYYAFTDGKLARQTGRWKPWNPTVVIRLRKRGDPIPMFVHRVASEELPVLNEEVGFDLLKGDWTVPHGDGEVADFLFRGVRDFDEKPDYPSDVLRLTFSNEADGLIELRQRYGDSYGLLLPAVAPENGYTTKWEWRPGLMTSEPEEGWTVSVNNDQDNNYYFRVRSRLDEKGNIVSAMYGKIYWGIGFGNGTYPERFPIRFLYYLNPDGTRNTEFDVNRNLNPNPGHFSPQP